MVQELDRAFSSAGAKVSLPDDLSGSVHDDPETFALKMIKNDPFTTIAEIRAEFERVSGGELSAGGKYSPFFDDENC